MIGLNELVKEGGTQLSGVSEATLQSIDAVKKLSEILRTSYGPRGMNKIIVNHLEKLFVTNDAATIIKELEIIHPAAKISVLASQRQEEEIGDGTNLVIVFCGELLQNAELLIRKGLHPTEIISGYTKALEKSLQILEELTVHQIEDIRNLEEVSKCIKPSIASKQFGYEDLLSKLVAEACIQILPKNPRGFNVDNVRVSKILGGGVFDTAAVKGHVLARDTEGTIKHVKDAKVAVFVSGFDASKTETKDSVVLNTADELLNYSAGEEKRIEAVKISLQAHAKLVKELANADVKVVVSGGAVGEMALHFLERYQMMVCKVLSKFELRRICRAVGATPLVRLGAPSAEEMGFASAVTVEEIGSSKVTIFRQDTQESGISTVVVRGSTNNLMDDIERAVDDGVNVFKGITRDNRFIPGASASEVETSIRLQSYADSTPGLVQYAIRKFGEAFEVVPRTIAENAGLKSTDTLAALYAAHAKGQSNAGINILEGEVRDAVEMGVLDHLLTKQTAIRLATDAAITILRVDQIIMQKRAGGPKPPKQGPMDADD